MVTIETWAVFVLGVGVYGFWYAGVQAGKDQYAKWRDYAETPRQHRLVSAAALFYAGVLLSLGFLVAFALLRVVTAAGL